MVLSVVQDSIFLMDAELPDGTKGTMQTASIDEYLKNGGNRW